MCNVTASTCQDTALKTIISNVALIAELEDVPELCATKTEHNMNRNHNIKKNLSTHLTPKPYGTKIW